MNSGIVILYKNLFYPFQLIQRSDCNIIKKYEVQNTVETRYVLFMTFLTLSISTPLFGRKINEPFRLEN